MENKPYYKVSDITGKKYDLFSIVRILNIQQIIFFLSKKIPVQDIEISEDRNSGKPVLVFYFKREDTKEAYDEWCKRTH